MEFDNHCNYGDAHDYSQHMRILLRSDKVILPLQIRKSLYIHWSECRISPSLTEAWDSNAFFSVRIASGKSPRFAPVPLIFEHDKPLIDFFHDFCFIHSSRGLSALGLAFLLKFIAPPAESLFSCYNYSLSQQCMVLLIQKERLRLALQP